MNERIKELVGQALFESDFDDERNIKITMDIFAELIIKECVLISRTSTDGFSAGRRMEEYFGVE